jgi:hypothetical protein
VSDVVIWHEHQGWTAGVHAALAYYYEHLDEIREEMRAESAAADRLQADNQSILPARLNQAKRGS